jgi:hypothetical protein
VPRRSIEYSLLQKRSRFSEAPDFNGFCFHVSAGGERMDPVMSAARIQELHDPSSGREASPKTENGGSFR